jgi:periplasmic protein TonB
MSVDTGMPLVAAGDGERARSWSIVVSFALHAGAIALVFVLSQSLYRSEEYRRPPTFTLVNFLPPAPETPPPREQVKRATARQAAPEASAPAPESQSPVQEAAPDVAEKNPVPATEPLSAPPAASASNGGPATGSAAGAGDIGQPLAVASASVLDNTSFAPIFNPKPAYPAIALSANIQGYVDVELVVTPAGTIESFAIVKVWGHPAFGDETAKVIRRWRFPPPRIGGKPVKIKYDYRVNFTLN